MRMRRHSRMSDGRTGTTVKDTARRQPVSARSTNGSDDGVMRVDHRGGLVNHEEVEITMAAAATVGDRAPLVWAGAGGHASRRLQPHLTTWTVTGG